MTTVNRIEAEKTLFLCCDHQEFFAPLIYGAQTIFDTAKILIKTAALTGIPILVTEQTPQTFGHISKNLAQELPLQHCKTIPKTSFSMLNEESRRFLDLYPHRKTAVLFGGETHICILNTFLDLIDSGYKVFLVTDGISSKRRLDRSSLFRRMEQAGGILTTSESVIFEIVKDSSNPIFKKLLPIIKSDRAMTIPKL